MNARKPTVYVAGPYRHPCPVDNTRRAITLAMEIRDRCGCVPYVPHLSLLCDFIAPREDLYWLELGLDWVRECDAVFRVGGASEGSDAEVELARQLGKPVFNRLDSLYEWVQHEWKAV